MPNENEEKEQVEEKNAGPRFKTTALNGIIEAFQANRGDSIAYIVMSLGLFLCFFGSLGGLLVGFVMGLYFSKAIVKYPILFQEFLVQEGIFRGFIVIGSILAISISAPGLAIGVVLGALSRPLFGEAIHDIVSNEKKELLHGDNEEKEEEEVEEAEIDEKE